MPATKIMLIRHAEKPNGRGAEQGVDENGAADAKSLSVRGWERAGALVCYFAPSDGKFTNPRITTPEAIFAVAPSPAHPSLRPVQTVRPLAQALRLSVRQDFCSEDPLSEVVAAVEAATGPVLMSWRHEAMCELANLLLGRDDAPQWPKDRFDVVWVFDRSNRQWRFNQVAQLLLPGDSLEVIETPKSERTSV